MADNSAWRFECCNIFANALADNPRATVTICITPYGRRGLASDRFITLSLHNNGKLLGACRHQVDAHNAGHWSTIVQVYVGEALT